jgi:hypothetical protein
MEQLALFEIAATTELDYEGLPCADTATALRNFFRGWRGEMLERLRCGATDAEIIDVCRATFGVMGGAAHAGTPHLLYSYRGGEHPTFYNGELSAHGRGLRGPALAAAVRATFNIPKRGADPQGTGK